MKKIFLILTVILLLVSCSESNKTSDALNQEYLRQVETYNKQLQDYEERQLRADRQADRMDVLLDRWEKQADRYDALLDKWEKENRI